MEFEAATEQLIEAVCRAAELSETELEAVTATPLLYQQLLTRLQSATPEKQLRRFSEYGRCGHRLSNQAVSQ